MAARLGVDTHAMQVAVREHLQEMGQGVAARCVSNTAKSAAKRHDWRPGILSMGGAHLIEVGTMLAYRAVAINMCLRGACVYLPGKSFLVHKSVTSSVIQVAPQPIPDTGPTKAVAAA